MRIEEKLYNFLVEKEALDRAIELTENADEMSCLRQAFVWSKTKEGAEYWGDISDEFEASLPALTYIEINTKEK